MISELKTRQSRKIRELGGALITAGALTLDEQAKALGLGRSTTWTVTKGNHKASGLSTSIINRMLMSPQLPQRARTKIVEYVQEKSSGLHGHNQRQLRKFVGRLLIGWPEIERRQGVRSSPSHRSCHALRPPSRKAENICSI
jgi:hypothetical protein